MTDSRIATYEHIQEVRSNLASCITELVNRSLNHDQSKLQNPEVEVFDEVTEELSGLEYGSDEYRACLVRISAALKHHYKYNRHHPQHFKDGISGMNLIDLLEMVCDWEAASRRGDSGDIDRSLEINQERFGYSDELATILKNTVEFIR